MHLPFMIHRQHGLAALFALALGCTPQARALEPGMRNPATAPAATLAKGSSTVDAGGPAPAANTASKQSQTKTPGKKAKPGKGCPPNAKGKASRRCIPPAEQSEPTAF
jgi:hypothetical protein